MGTLLIFATVAAQPVSRQVVAARGFLFAVIIYGLGSFADEWWTNGGIRLPHVYVAQAIYHVKPATMSSDVNINEIIANERAQQIAFLNLSALLGLFGGGLARWSYQVHEQRQFRVLKRPDDSRAS
ncbi:MAG: hypothetical protein SGJ19_28450 [Planctomycetia bacterium]|nr:hypothetical protein [Planctomycetia bacterium]